MASSEHAHRGGGRTIRRRAVLLLFTALPALWPAAVHAQRDRSEEETRWFEGFPGWTVEVYAGVADHGRLLLQAVDVDDGIVDGIIDGIVPQRALTASTSFSFGGAVGFTILRRTTVRLGFNHTSADLEYEDDTGLDIDLFDDDDVGDLGSNILNLEVMRDLLPARIRLTPYAGVGLALAWWNLDDEDRDLIVAGGGDDTLTRWGGIGTVGLKYRLSPAWALRAEAATYGIRSPFTGEESFVTTDGLTVDEPTHIRQTNFRLVVSYTFGRPGRRAEK